jgi:diguanylate cyclase (GGDEF)-like protein
MLSYKNQSQLMSFFVNKVAEIFQARKVSLMLVDPESKELSIKASYGLSPSANSTKIKLGQMFGGWVAQEGSSLLVKDVEKEFPDLGKDRLSRYMTKSFIIVPIVIKEGVIGILNITDRKDIAIFTENDLKTINFLCYILASYIENIKLFKINTKLIAVDVLTGLFNHRHFQEHLLEEIYHAERYRHPLSLLMLDIDNFSLYNQTYGYSSGDSALKQIARIIKENTRRVDIVARYGPEEFMIILPSTRLKQAMVAAERIRQKISYSIFVENRKSSLGMDRLTVSIGVVEHKVGITKEELLRRVKNALLRAKQKGKNCIQVFK